MTDSSPVLAQLMQVIAERKVHRPANSYTTKLFDGGAAVIGGKITEEAAEVVEAAEELGDPGHHHLVREAADLIYHLLVLLASRDVGLDEVEAELARRFGISGLDEKASRKQK
ncbi:MAG TPA: phosphoribosyl-ATP diphosphatase [Pirellulales bacterium]|jgi:phosphoribosyl-ATP pyrophosphohydrolase|nr:phosphoribosyl-ATP diphosphatase [Pirellulales bacterium]